MYHPALPLFITNMLVFKPYKVMTLKHDFGNADSSIVYNNILIDIQA
jgi:hypothetical protein